MQHRRAPADPRRVRDVGVFRSHAADILRIDRRFASEHGQIGVEQHVAIRVGRHRARLSVGRRIDVGGGEHDQSGDLVASCARQAKGAQLTFGERSTVGLVAGGSRVVDRVVKERRQSHCDRIVYPDGAAERPRIADHVIDMGEAVVSPVRFAIALQHAFETRVRSRPRTGGVGPGRQHRDPR